MAWRNLTPPAPPPPFPEPHRAGESSSEGTDPNTTAACAHICVLASGSSGNCTVLRTITASGRPDRTALLDAGLSPTRTRRLLADRGIALSEIDDIVLTHLDADHFHPGWRRVRDCRATLRLHRRHLGKAERRGLLLGRNEPFDDAFELGGTCVEPVMMDHDHLGVAAFRIETPCGCSLGFATDLGRSTRQLTDHLAGVGVLAIESNYCPVMQADSDRPAFLKNRITGGAGHLSNEECAEAVRAISPASSVVLLHLSRQCNTPELASRAHADAPYDLCVSSQTEPTPWVRLTPGSPRPEGVASIRPARAHRQGLLFAPQT